jgi:hypothetical protein
MEELRGVYLNVFFTCFVKQIIIAHSKKFSGPKLVGFNSQSLKYMAEQTLVLRSIFHSVLSFLVSSCSDNLLFY